MSKKILCLLLAFTMMMTVFAGCGQTIDEEPAATTSATDDSGTAVTGADSDSNADSTDNTDTTGTSTSNSAMASIIANWSYDFDYSFIEENGIEYVWERLDENYKISLGEIMNAIRAGSVYCPLSVGFSNDEKQDLLTLVSNCCMFYTWIGTSFTASVNEDGTVVGVTINYRGIDYESDIEPIMTALENRLQEIVSSIPVGSSEFETLKYLHDYLILNCDYSDTAGTSPFSAYGALVEGYATCQGYADAMHLLLARAGFETMFVTGIGSDESVTHKWNYVMCEDGHWYIIDPTWDDPSDISDLYFVGYCYFLISDEEILKDHVAKHESNYYETPYADSMDLNFFNVMGYYATTTDEAYDILLEQAKSTIDSERRCLYIKFESSDAMREIYETLRDAGQIAEIIEAGNSAAGTSYRTDSWSRTFNDELGILTITLKEPE
ncbi:MAG: hypothetical protein LUG86_05780 [Oscillospiraceae bacterium]|nr:hypothetical protein [Oscillospiraceae bacterium]